MYKIKDDIYGYKITIDAFNIVVNKGVVNYLYPNPFELSCGDINTPFDVEIINTLTLYENPKSLTKFLNFEWSWCMEEFKNLLSNINMMPNEREKLVIFRKLTDETGNRTETFHNRP